MPEKQLIFFDIDGLDPDVLYEALDDKETNVSRIAGKGLRVERAATIFPSVTLCCQASMFTGVFPAKHGVMGNRWFQRSAEPPLYRKYTDAKTAAGNFGFALFGWPNIILPERPGLQFADRDISPDAVLVYEMMKAKGLTSWQMFNQYSRGVDKWIKPTRPEMLIFAVCHEEWVHNVRWDRASFSHLLKDIRKAGGAPNLLVVYISGLDNHSHQHGPQTQKEYFRKILDPLIGEVSAELAKYRPLDEYHFLFTSDHRQAAVIRQKEYRILTGELNEILGGAEGGGFKLYDDEKGGIKADDTAVAGVEAGTAQVHVMNRNTLKWPDQPRFEEDILPAARTFEKIRNTNGGFVEMIFVRREFGADYEVFEKENLISLENYFAGKEAEYPDAVRRMRGVNGARSGDVIALVDYNTGRYIEDKEKGGVHGHLHASDSLIPFTLSGPGIPDKLIKTASLIDIVPTIGALFGLDSSTADGVSIL